MKSTPIMFPRYLRRIFLEIFQFVAEVLCCCLKPTPCQRRILLKEVVSVSYHFGIVSSNLATVWLLRTVEASHINWCDFSVSTRVMFRILFRVFEERTPSKVGMLDIAIRSAIEMHQVEADIIAFVNGSQQEVSRMDWTFRHLEVKKCFSTYDFGLHIYIC